MKTILLTGANGGIGSVIKKVLEQNGDSVIGLERKDADLGSYDDSKKLATSLSDDIDWIICAHGYIDPETNLENQNPEAIEETFRVNILSLFYIAQLFLKRLKMGMIFISSTSGIAANGRHAAYSASKAGVNSFAQALARNRVKQTFIALCPGPTATTMRARVGVAGGQDPSEVAKIVVEIVSSAGEYRSGDIISVRDGKVIIESRV